MNHLARFSSRPSALDQGEACLVQQALAVLESKHVRRTHQFLIHDDFCDYLRLRFAGCMQEQERVMFLGVDRRLLACETVSFGDHKSVSSDLRQVLFRAVQLGADAVVFAHNHPAGGLTPSEPDMLNLVRNALALAPFKIEVIDSFVVTASGIASVRQHRDARDKREQLQLEQARQWKRLSKRRISERAAARTTPIVAAQGAFA